MQQARIMALSGSRMKDMDAKLICCTRMRRSSSSSSYTAENVRVQQEKETKSETDRQRVMERDDKLLLSLVARLFLNV